MTDVKNSNHVSHMPSLASDFSFSIYEKEMKFYTFLVTGKLNMTPGRDRIQSRCYLVYRQITELQLAKNTSYKFLRALIKQDGG